MNQQTSKKLVLFDFDGTLTHGDTLIRFLYFSMPLYSLCWGALRLLFVWAALALSGKWNTHRAKELLFAVYFKNHSAEDLDQLGRSFYQGPMQSCLHAEMMRVLRKYKSEGATVALVSASLKTWLQPLAEHEQIELICTELAFTDGKFNGQFYGLNCQEEEKVKRIQARFHLADYQVIAYGNSSGDIPMLALAQEAFWVKNGVVRKIQDDL
ncbi:MAG: haloacid dehalogenase-like hydrolase [Saprospiraceae bacterium]|nr:haloacid dehalogenase-like hydrolase [Saprospiraceae bacterium]